MTSFRNPYADHDIDFFLILIVYEKIFKYKT